MIKVWTIQEVKNPDTVMLEQHIEDCNLLLWEYKNDAMIFWLMHDDYDMINKINEDIEYCNKQLLLLKTE